MTTNPSSNLLSGLVAYFGQPNSPNPRDWPHDDAAAYDRWWLERCARKSVLDQDGCWVWTGWLQTKGYAGTSYHGRSVAIHRQVYKMFVQPDLATEQVVCHRCDKPACWNLDHLWLGTQRDNMYDMLAKGRHNYRGITHCKRGHEFTPENTYWKPLRTGGMARGCKLCSRIKSRLAIGWSLEDALKLDKVPAGRSREHVR